ncbi:group II truncated hemoglobin [Azoarcus sp. L1K30]|uniref:group II truncated hemoglobin n=1 Tax=Azoarcus sp. L1K30 TaxID=2820277 RepID=UPI001B840150|nr:group II truncated hemoglobin [Azoarcus sp. L1K30]MBR0565289.1 group II truncated hemoglobin [Azoarcus sp. L1K30]
MQPDARNTLPQLTPYDEIGGEVVVRALVKRFYQLMDMLPETYGIRRMHAEDLAGSEEKLFLFLSGWFGGPQLYVERFGPPFLRARHLPFSIGSAERDQWMLCMSQALQEHIQDEALRKRLHESFAALANHMRNRAETA